MIAAVVAMLQTRLFVSLTGFPRMGGAGLHVPHMLWGGLLKLLALVLVLAAIGKRSKRLAAPRWGNPSEGDARAEAATVRDENS